MPVDPEKERWRLAWLYAGMTDDELQNLADDAGSLTDIAKRALRFELSRRGLPVELDEPPAPAGESRPPMLVAGELVTLRRFRDMPEALLARSVLESAGIECSLGDVNIIRTDWLWSNLVGGIKLRVREEDLEAAGKLLDQNVPERFDVQGVGSYRQPRCPRCQSLEVSFEDLDKPVAAAALFVGAPVALRRPLWKCRSCGSEWQEPEATAS
jgi:hypothetical protein